MSERIKTCWENAPLHPYQGTAADFCLDRMFTKGQKGAGLFLDPGLGKTRITLEVMQTLFAFGAAKRALIVAPLRVCRLVWPAEAYKWQMPFQMRVMCGRVKEYLAGGVSPYVQAEVVNPESLHLLEPYAGRWDLAVIDESTKFKNWSSKRMKSMKKLLPSFDRRLILTGTPAANSLSDLHSQVYCLDDGEALGKNVTVFRARYMTQSGYLGRQWQMREGLEQDLLDAIAPMILCMKAEDHLDMPELLTNDMTCELSAPARREYDKMKRQLLAELESGDILALNRASAYQKMKQLANGAVYDAERNVHVAHDEKLNMLCDLVDELSGKPVLAFYQFQHDAERIQKRFPKTPVLSGATKAKQAESMIAAWNNGDLPIFLVQPQAAGHGLNLQSGPCADMTWFGIGDSPEVYDQAVRRIYRQGQQNRQVRVHRLLAHDTVDGVIVQRLEGKFKTQSDFIGALKNHARN